jgi:MSHA biogenesis protein MshO
MTLALPESQTGVNAMCRNARRYRFRGATLMELVVVIALIAILSAVAAIAVREPLNSYADAARRAEMTDVADTALRRMGRDIRLALPNSLRTKTAGAVHLELLLVRTGGRYRVSPIAGTPQADELSFDAPDTSFNILGAPSTLPGQVIQAGDLLVVRNESASTSATPFNAYTAMSSACTGSNRSETCNSARINAPAPPPAGSGSFSQEYKLNFDSRLFNYNAAADRGLPSPGNRFYVLSGPVSYVCAPNAALDGNGNAAGTLTRVSNYAIALDQPTAFGSASQSVLANNVSACQISYDADALANNGLVAIRLQITRGNETVSLYHEVHVDNAP